jgi:type II secretory pathway pseudopilin PulG
MVAAAMRRIEGGFTYLALLFFVATMGALMVITGLMWSTEQQRAKERELLFVGNAFREAIGAYYERTPGTLKRYPRSLNDLLRDDRQAMTMRHLRRIYVDPMTRKVEWGMLHAPDGGIVGVYSLSDAEPMKKGAFLDRDQAFSNAKRYSDWRFVYDPARRAN